jgi:hypothetical protein
MSFDYYALLASKMQFVPEKYKCPSPLKTVFTLVDEFDLKSKTFAEKFSNPFLRKLSMRRGIMANRIWKSPKFIKNLSYFLENYR